MARIDFIATVGRGRQFRQALRRALAEKVDVPSGTSTAPSTAERAEIAAMAERWLDFGYLAEELRLLAEILPLSAHLLAVGPLGLATSVGWLSRDTLRDFSCPRSATIETWRSHDPAIFTMPMLTEDRN
jgi:hypothetical protein